MKTDKVRFFSDLLEKNKRIFKVPVYQRNYDWSHEQCKKLFSDIIKAHKYRVEHFTGAVVYIGDIDGGSGLDEFLIIDGQQRITTMYILLKSLLDAAKEGSWQVKDEIEDVMFNRNCNEKNKLKLKPIKTDNEQLTSLINDKLDRMDKSSNIYKNYALFKKLIKEEERNGLTFDDILAGIKRLVVVEIILDKTKDNAQEIFESINSTGLDLSLSDLVRNFLLMDVDNQDRLYNEFWLEIEKNVGYSNLAEFVIAYLNSQMAKPVTNNNAYTLFKESCKNNHLTNEDALRDLRRVSKYYAAFIGLFREYDKEIQNYLEALNLMKQRTILPFIFNLFTDFENKQIDKDELCKVLEYLLTYLVRKVTCDNTKNLLKFMKSIYKRIKSDDYPEYTYSDRFIIYLNKAQLTDRMPSDDEFRKALVNNPLYNNKDICKYLLLSIENSTKEPLKGEELTIEHILPQSKKAIEWRKELGDEYDKIYETYLHTLGNLTLTGYNSELGTKSFAQKKKIIKENSNVGKLNKDILESERWDETAIMERAKNLSNMLTEIFNYVKIDVNESDSKLCLGIDEGYDFSKSKPQGFYLCGDFTETEASWVSLQKKFMELVYDLNPEVFLKLANENYHLSNRKTIFLTHDESQLRRASEIKDTGFFYETNLSANAHLEFIKEIIIQLGFDVDDFKVYLGDKRSVKLPEKKPKKLTLEDYLDILNKEFPN